ncbi:hypothetical protein EBR43_04520 [bacterium]|jgi:acyl-CoA thioesterase-1|nr:hypothetical protein [bacterium]NBX72504.1 hypothetical protein [bacterium]
MLKNINSFLILLFIIPYLNSQQLVILGDSLSDGFGLTESSPWPYYLKECDCQTINLSNAGSTLQEGYQRLQNYIAEHPDHPHTLLIALGSNDGLRAYPFSKIEKDLSGLVDFAINNNFQPILVEWSLPPNYGAYADKFKDIFHRVAATKKIRLLPFPFEPFATDFNYFQQDGYHPNDKAQPLIAQQVCLFLNNN